MSLSRDRTRENGMQVYSEEAFPIGQWTDSRHSQAQNEDQYHASAAGRNPDFG